MRAKINKKTVKSEINITPFTDVILVLLIIFMIAMPSIEHQLEINLPKTESSDRISSSQENIEVFVLSGGIIIDGKIISLDDVTEVIKTKLKEKSKAAIIVKGDAQVAYDNVIQFMDRAKKGGAKKFALSVDVKK